MAVVNETGNRYGRLVVIERQRPAKTFGKHHARWICQCDCGQETVTYGTNLRQGLVKSCGCGHFGWRQMHPLTPYQLSRKPGFGIGPSAHSKGGEA